MKLLGSGGSISCPASTTITPESAAALRAEIALPQAENKMLEFNQAELRKARGEGLCVIAFLKGARRPNCMQESTTSISKCPIGNQFIYGTYLERG